MNKKKCPKCGEDNPAEAVMCWACYTPLTGAATASGAAAPGGTDVTYADDEKKKIPPWQLGVIGVALLGAVFVGARTMMPSSPPEEEETYTPPPKRDGGGAAPPPMNPSAPAPPSPAPNVPSAPAAAKALAAQEAPYTVVVPPNPRLSVATMAIVPNDGTSTGPQAATLAAYTRRQYKGNTRRWSSLYIYVFADAESAKYFAAYMKRRKGVALTTDDYAYLSNLWRSVLVRYEYTNSKGKRIERALYPYNNPTGWWYEKPTSA